MEKKCRYCPRVCHKQEHLDRHERTHTKVRPYRCDACEKYFVRSDTLKRHQKLHVADGNKSMQRGAKSSKRARVNTSVDASQSDRYTGSYIDQCPPQEISEPQFCYDTLEAWDYSSFDPMFTNDGVPFMKINEAGNWFNASYIPFEESCIGSFGSEFTMDPEFPWEQVEGTRPLNAIC